MFTYQGKADEWYASEMSVLFSTAPKAIGPGIGAWDNVTGPLIVPEFRGDLNPELAVRV